MSLTSCIKRNKIHACYHIIFLIYNFMILIVRYGKNWSFLHIPQKQRKQDVYNTKVNFFLGVSVNFSVE